MLSDSVNLMIKIKIIRLIFKMAIRIEAATGARNTQRELCAPLFLCVITYDCNRFAWTCEFSRYRQPGSLKLPQPRCSEDRRRTIQCRFWRTTFWYPFHLTIPFLQSLVLTRTKHLFTCNTSIISWIICLRIAPITLHLNEENKIQDKVRCINPPSRDGEKWIYSSNLRRGIGSLKHRSGKLEIFGSLLSSLPSASWDLGWYHIAEQAMINVCSPSGNFSWTYSLGFAHCQLLGATIMSPPLTIKIILSVWRFHSSIEIHIIRIIHLRKKSMLSCTKD